MSETPTTLTYLHTDWDAGHGGYRTVTLSLDLPYEVMLRLVIDPPRISAVATFFISAADSRLLEAAEYLRGFLKRIQSDCQTSSLELPIRQDRRGSAFDFPRPTPVSLLLVQNFFKVITRHRALYEAVWCEQFRSLGLERYDIAIKTLRLASGVVPAKHWSDIPQEPDPWAAIEAGDLQTALHAFATREMLDYRSHGRCHSDVWICGFGIVLWLMGDAEGAGRVWSRACEEALRGKFKYSSTGTFEAGLLLWFASVWLKNDDWHEEAAALFDKLLRKKWLMGAGFSILLAKLLRREIALPEVRAGFIELPPQAQESDERKALFYAGVRAYEEGKLEETRHLWAQAKEPTDTTAPLEYYLLAHERKKLTEGLDKRAG